MSRTLLTIAIGYRPGKNAHQAIDAIKEELRGKYNYVVEADINGFFNNIDHNLVNKDVGSTNKGQAIHKAYKEMVKSRSIDQY
ncbi:MAG TPA: hypothetical protein VIO64_11600 [Pseudobacteroides sp.]|uniref:hypothetical protein n=1 Tax=Pseudobacteroides sp. TaxID=1968840 RepID=UPI002F955E00